MIKAVGFEPVGQVFGAEVYKVGMPGGDVCPSLVQERGPAWATLSGFGFGPLVRASYDMRDTAIGQMVAECSALGGHGVVGVSFTVDRVDGDVLECTAIGTAIRAQGDGRALGLRLKAPFTGMVTGQEFANLVMAGFMPVSIVYGISIGVCHDDWLGADNQLKRRLTRKLAGNVEVPTYTDLVNQSRRDARKELLRRVARSGCRGVLVQRPDLRIDWDKCPRLMGRDYRAEATMTGTAIRALAAKRKRDGGPALAVVSLDPQRRQAARARLA
jgi:uncharacterized protein YbjQ (UPF0145 family)